MMKRPKQIYIDTFYNTVDKFGYSKYFALIKEKDIWKTIKIINIQRKKDRVSFLSACTEHILTVGPRLKCLNKTVKRLHNVLAYKNERGFEV